MPPETLGVTGWRTLKMTKDFLNCAHFVSTLSVVLLEVGFGVMPALLVG